MSLKKYKKLQFEIAEEDQICHERVEDYCDEDDVEEPQTPEKTGRDKTEHKIIPQGMEKGDGKETGKDAAIGKDPNLVTTRDYYGLAQTVGGNHSCLILVTNRSETDEIRDPVIFTNIGYTRIPPDSRIPPLSNSYCAFRKPSIVTKGTSGVMSYEYARENGRSKRFAVMWKIPYRIINHEENEVAVKWLDIDLDDPIDLNTHTSRELYREMENSSDLVMGDHISRSVAKKGKTLKIVNEESKVQLNATFSGSCKALVKVDFSPL